MPKYSKLISFLVPFLLGIMLKEILIFIYENGLRNEHTLARSLFIIMMCAFGLFFIWCCLKFRQVSNILEDHGRKIIHLLMCSQQIANEVIVLD